jgi:hypothetical protein
MGGTRSQRCQNKLYTTVFFELRRLRAAQLVFEHTLATDGANVAPTVFDTTVTEVASCTPPDSLASCRSSTVPLPSTMIAYGDESISLALNPTVAVACVQTSSKSVFSPAALPPPFQQHCILRSHPTLPRLPCWFVLRKLTTTISEPKAVAVTPSVSARKRHPRSCGQAMPHTRVPSLLHWPTKA